MTLKLTATNPRATISVNLGATAVYTSNTTIPLSGSATTINVVVKSANSLDTHTYKFIVYRNGSSNSVLALIKSSLEAHLVRTGSTDQLKYDLKLRSYATSATLLLTSEDAGATMSINGSPSGTYHASKIFSLANSSTPVHIVVTAEDGVSTRNYDVNIIRPASPSTLMLENRGYADIVKYNDGSAPQPPVEVLVHQGLSPNGDGVNDKFTIDGIGAYPENLVKIINRSGEVIYQVKGYDNNNNALDGHASNGTLQQAGTYFYSLEYKKGNETVRKTGYIVIKY